MVELTRCKRPLETDCRISTQPRHLVLLRVGGTLNICAIKNLDICDEHLDGNEKESSEWVFG